MAQQFDYLLLGGGTSCGYAAAAIREVDPHGTIGIVSADTEPPYDRPPFSKNFLLKDAMEPSDAHAKDESFYGENNIELMLETTAVSLDTKEDCVRLANGETIRYGKLLYALGSEPNQLDVPGGDAVHLLRTAGDSALIREEAADSQTVAVIGGGWIGPEVTASLRSRGLEVTLIVRQERVWPRMPSEHAAKAVQHELQNMATVHFGKTVEEVSPGRPISVKVSGGDHIEADLAVAGIGVKPRVQLAAKAGIPMGETGISADATLRTEIPNIWVAGDVAEYLDPVLGKTFRAEHHLHAKWTGAHVGKCMAGEESEYRKVPYFFSDVGELSMVLRGDPASNGHSYVFGDPDTPEFTHVFVNNKGRVRLMIDLRRDYKAQDPINDLFEGLILNQTDLTPMLDKMNSPEFDVMLLKELT